MQEAESFANTMVARAEDDVDKALSLMMASYKLTKEKGELPLMFQCLMWAKTRAMRLTSTSSGCT